MNRFLLWDKLERTLSQQFADFPGIAGIAIKSLSTGDSLTINANEVSPTASTIKIHVLAQLLLRAERGEIDLAERIPVLPEMHVGGSGVLSYLAGPVELSLLDMANLMIIASDNTATNICIERAGLEATNALIHDLGLTQTHLRRKMMDHLAAVRELENVSTPSELVTMLDLLYQGKPSPNVAERCLMILKKPKNGFIDKAMPPNVACANKPGWVDGAMCDAALVYLPRRPYIVAIMTKYALCDPLTQENFVVACAQIIHQSMSALDKTNQFGRSVYP